MGLLTIDKLQELSPALLEETKSIFYEREAFLFQNVHEAAPGKNQFIDIYFWFRSGEIEYVYGDITARIALPRDREKYVCDDRAFHITIHFPKYTAYLTFPSIELFWAAVSFINLYIENPCIEAEIFHGFTEHIQIPEHGHYSLKEEYVSNSGIEITEFTSHGRIIDEETGKKFTVSARNDVLDLNISQEDGYLSRSIFNLSDSKLYMSTDNQRYQLLIEDTISNYEVWTFGDRDDYYYTLAILTAMIGR